MMLASKISTKLLINAIGPNLQNVERAVSIEAGAFKSLGPWELEEQHSQLRENPAEQYTEWAVSAIFRKARTTGG